MEYVLVVDTVFSGIRLTVTGDKAKFFSCWFTQHIPWLFIWTAGLSLIADILNTK